MELVLITGLALLLAGLIPLLLDLNYLAGDVGHPQPAGSASAVQPRRLDR
ncbi:MAG: hypothetical protein N838_25115 [Thiohalocapsa sp. PB-PSB1]|nr:MAG: hypothetical protein N838_25115 [Thiohalocapsa sp. PB-PSB1]